MQVAPVAKLDDGRFDRVIIEADATIADLTIAAIQAKFGDKRAPRTPPPYDAWSWASAGRAPFSDERLA